ncbi:unnamed protein product [Ilex paraguariensis]|uniref:DNA-directed RNA polymerase n=1 Tax=Ilex paraguariensis TaxID=185542 RepID=A0ABC8S7C6_9AQUA
MSVRKGKGNWDFAMRCASSNSDCPISHASQLSNPFLGPPLESGKCESCGTAEPGQCEGHFGYIELPIPVYHPDHDNELKRILSLLCLKMKKRMMTGVGWIGDIPIEKGERLRFKTFAHFHWKGQPERFRIFG